MAITDEKQPLINKETRTDYLAGANGADGADGEPAVTGKLHKTVFLKSFHYIFLSENFSFLSLVN